MRVRLMPWLLLALAVAGCATPDSVPNVPSVADGGGQPTGCQTETRILTSAGWVANESLADKASFLFPLNLLGLGYEDQNIRANGHLIIPLDQPVRRGYTDINATFYLKATGAAFNPNVPPGFFVEDINLFVSGPQVIREDLVMAYGYAFYLDGGKEFGSDQDIRIRDHFYFSTGTPEAASLYLVSDPDVTGQDGTTWKAISRIEIEYC